MPRLISTNNLLKSSRAGRMPPEDQSIGKIKVLKIMSDNFFPTMRRYRLFEKAQSLGWNYLSSAAPSAERTAGDLTPPNTKSGSTTDNDGLGFDDEEGEAKEEEVHLVSAASPSAQRQWASSSTSSSSSSS
eukprot:Selendium_serpulae@DN7985_c0_g1_i1.p2